MMSFLLGAGKGGREGGRKGRGGEGERGEDMKLIYLLYLRELNNLKEEIVGMERKSGVLEELAQKKQGRKDIGGEIAELKRKIQVCMRNSKFKECKIDRQPDQFNLLCDVFSHLKSDPEGRFKKMWSPSCLAWSLSSCPLAQSSKAH